MVKVLVIVVIISFIVYCIVINFESTSHCSEKFNTMATCTRRQYLMDLVNSYSSSQSIEQVNVSKFDGMYIVCVCVCLSVCLFVCLSVCLSLSVSMSVFVHVHELIVCMFNV